MFAKFLDAITAPAQKIAESAGKQIGREFQREADRAAERLAKQATQKASRRIAGLFSALAPEDEEPAAVNTGSSLARGMFAPPDDAA